MINMKKVTVIGLAGMIALASMLPAFAEEKTTTAKPNKINFEQLTEKYKTVLDGLVQNGTISQEQEEAILKAAEDKKMKGMPEGRGGKPGGGFSKLVEEGTITQDQADAIKQALESSKESKKSIGEIKAELVEAGTITQEQADALFKAPGGKGEEGRPGGMRGDRFAKLVEDGTITQEQSDAIKQAIESGKESKKLMDEIKAGLVENGTITQEQADSILKAPEGKPGEGRPEGPKGMHGDRFSKLVEEGTITQEQADAITQAMESARESKMSMDEVKSSLVANGTITQEQADSILKAPEGKPGEGRPEEPKGMHGIRIDKLVEEGTITQDQADAVIDAIKSVIESDKKSQ